MSDKKIRLLKMELPETSRQYLVVQDHRDLIEHLAILKDEGSIGDTMTITVQEMTQNEFEDLNEFEGW